MTLWIVLAFFLFTLAAVAASGYAFLRLSPAGVSGVLIATGALVSRPSKSSDVLRKLLFRAGFRAPGAIAAFKGAQVLVAVALSLVIVAIVSFWKADSARALLPGICGLGFGFMIPQRVLEYHVRARAQRIRAAIPPALDLLVLAMEAGQSLDQALQDTASTIKPTFPDLSSELGFCHLEMRAGAARADALRRLGERSGDQELKKLAAVLIDGERFGSSLGPALRTHAHYLRTRMRQRAQEAARKLSVKLIIPVFLLIFPSVVLVTLGPAYIQLQGFLDNFLK